MSNPTRILLICLFALAVPVVALAQCDNVEIDGYRWCGDTTIPFYWGDGLNGSCSIISNPSCYRMKAAIRAAVVEWNLTAASDFSFPFNLQESGNLANGVAPTYGIVFSYGDLQLGIYSGCTSGLGSSGETSPCGGAVAPGVHFGVTHYNYSAAATDVMAEVDQACIHLSNDVPWVDGTGSGVDRKTVALHEIGHALGIGHSFTGSCLMENVGGCNRTHGIDASAYNAATCIYGSNLGVSCDPQWGIIPYVGPTGGQAVLMGFCDCTDGGCPSSSKIFPPYTYELAISESDGPYSVYATLTESELAGNAYEHHFATDYTNARLRLRVYDGATLVDETFTRHGMVITASATATPPAVASRLALRASPNPFSARTQLEFELSEAATTELIVYDLAGRRVAELQRGSLPAGVHVFPWREANLANGVYLVVLRTPTSEARIRVAHLR